MWFTVTEEKPDIGTTVFKADDYYERLQYITGMWNDDKFLFYEMYSRLKESPFKQETVLDCDHVVSVSDITTVPLLMAYLERTGKEGGVSEAMLDFMWDMHNLYVRKMWQFGHAIDWMSKKEYSLLDNQDKWTKLVKATEELQDANRREEETGRKLKRRLKPAVIKYYPRIESTPNRVKRTRARSETIFIPKDTTRASKYLRAIRRKVAQVTKGKHRKYTHFQITREYKNPFAWDFGKTRLFDRTHTRLAGKRVEFSRFFHKLAKSLRFAKHEPVDWRTITLEELDKHRFSNDCWMAIKGRVYDVTSFIPKHPGGSVIRKGLGIDGTSLFVAVHPYVVFYEYLIGKQIGRLPNFQEHYHTEWEPPEYFNLYRSIKEWIFRRKTDMNTILIPRNPFAKYSPKVTFEQDYIYYIYTVVFPPSLKSLEDDWTLAIVNGFQVTVIKFIEPPYVWYGGFDLRVRVEDDSVYKWFSEDYNTLQLRIAKSYKTYVNRPIKDKRQDDGFFLSSYALKDMFMARVVERHTIATGVKLYGITVGMNKVIGVPIGCYVLMKILDEIRPYTPVCLPDEFENKFHEESGGFHTLFFIIKEFKEGDFTSMLHYIPIKGKILAGIDLTVSPGMGNFQVDFLYSNVEVMLLIAGGSGISVMTRIIQDYVLNREKLNGLNVCLVLFVRYRDECIWKEHWERLRKTYKWFHYYSGFTRVYRYRTEPSEKGEKIPSIFKVAFTPREFEQMKSQEASTLVTTLEWDNAKPNELYGYPSVAKFDFVLNSIPGAKDTEKHKAIVCGPYDFNRCCEKVLTEYGKHAEKDVWYFAG